MMLIGQYTSPFVCRVAIAMHLYGIPYDHRPWSVFRDPERVGGFNPLVRVPTLVLDDGEILVDSTTILDHLDETVGPERAMLAPRGAERRAGLRICALATGLADKAVSLVYDRAMHDVASDRWTARCTSQIAGVLDALEIDRASGDPRTPFWHGDAIGHADIAFGCAWRFIGEAHRALLDEPGRPSLHAHAERLEAIEAFRTVRASFSAPR